MMIVDNEAGSVDGISAERRSASGGITDTR